ncbi:MAG: lysophospholipid acyltransferase family protein [Prevotella sp.]|nr:lysophospholipid acyltransferase family protein [Prevotella sp.]
MKIVYYLVLAVWYLLSLLPFWVHYLLSDLLYLILYRMIGYRKKVVRQNLATSFPEKSEAELRKIERGFYHFFGDYIAESVKLMTISQKNLRKRMVFKGIEHVNEVLGSGQSITLYMGHYCNWEFVTSLQLWLIPGAQCGQIYHPIENESFDRLFLRLRQRQGSVSIPMQETLRRLLKFRSEKRVNLIGFLSDQKPHWVNIHHWVDFLHHDTPVLTGTERIVNKLDNAAFYLDMHRVRRGYYVGEFKLITRNSKEMKEFELTDTYFSMLEASIRRAPEYWLWSHNRWARTREEFNKRFEVVNGKVIAKDHPDNC